MIRHELTYKTHQLKLYIDLGKNSVQINVVNPSDSGHSVVKKYPVALGTSFTDINEVIEAVLAWDQLDATISSATQLFQNLPPAE